MSVCVIVCVLCEAPGPSSWKSVSSQSLKSLPATLCVPSECLGVPVYVCVHNTHLFRFRHCQKIAFVSLHLAFPRFFLSRPPRTSSPLQFLPPNKPEGSKFLNAEIQIHIQSRTECGFPAASFPCFPPHFPPLSQESLLHCTRELHRFQSTNRIQPAQSEFCKIGQWVQKDKIVKRAGEFHLQIYLLAKLAGKPGPSQYVKCKTWGAKRQLSFNRFWESFWTGSYNIFSCRFSVSIAIQFDSFQAFATKLVGLLGHAGMAKKTFPIRSHPRQSPTPGGRAPSWAICFP